jgi:hypothetical protein
MWRTIVDSSTSPSPGSVWSAQANTTTEADGRSSCRKSNCLRYCQPTRRAIAA